MTLPCRCSEAICRMYVRNKKSGCQCGFNEKRKKTVGGACATEDERGQTEEAEGGKRSELCVVPGGGRGGGGGLTFLGRGPNEKAKKYGMQCGCPTRKKPPEGTERGRADGTTRY